MRIRSLVAVIALLPATACYRVTVVTGAPPAPQVVNKPWQMGWVLGLVPPPELNVKEQCAQGVAQVQTQRSFLNGLVSNLTYSIFTPMSAKITCAGGPVTRGNDASAEALPAGEATRSGTTPSPGSPTG